MKKVIFVCFLTLSVCFSNPVNSNATKPSEITSPHPTTENTKQNAIISNESSTEHLVVGPISNSNKTEDKTTVQPTPEPTNKNETKPANTTTSMAPKDKPETPTTTVPSTTTTKADEKTSPTTPATKANGTSTQKPDISTTTSSGTPKDDVAHIVQARGFDGASFIGGIILTLALLAVGFMGFKYYKSQTERNYHTL